MPRTQEPNQATKPHAKRGIIMDFEEYYNKEIKGLNIGQKAACKKAWEASNRSVPKDWIPKDEWVLTEIWKAKAETATSIFEELESPELLEVLADLEHDRWGRWEKYREVIIRKSIEEVGKSDKTYTLKREDWIRKRETPYSTLTEKEKESDRVEARKTIAKIDQALKHKFGGKTLKE